MKLSTLNPKIGHRQKKKTRHGQESTQSGTQHKKGTWMREKRKQRTERPCLNLKVHNDKRVISFLQRE